jgi:hypothetical protein
MVMPLALTEGMSAAFLAGVGVDWEERWGEGRQVSGPARNQP